MDERGLVKKKQGYTMDQEHIKVLLIEDNPGDARLIREMMKEVNNFSFDLKCTSWLESGLKLIAKGEVDVVLLDLGLPDSQGFETFAKTYALKPQLPIIVLSGLKDEELAVKAVRNGAQDYLVKGQVNGNLIVRALRYAVERKRTEQELKKSFKRLRKSFEQTINALASSLEMRDPYTAGHQQRVTNLACAIAKEMALSREQVDGIRMAGAIHDIGKISVPAEILSKPDLLNEAEMLLIRNHPQVGYDILKEIEFPWPVAKIVLQHHERMDGSGYPSGLLGKDILLEARILGVADVVEAMSSHRPYRPALGVDKALEEISKNKGVLYDPKVIDACLKLFTKKGFEFKDEMKIKPHLLMGYH